MSISDIGPIYCINLKTRKDRLEKVSKLFNKLNCKVNFHIVNKHENGGVQGCFESHLSIINQAYDKGYERCVIFEDDIVLSPNYDKKYLREAIRFMNKNKDWEIFYLGFIPHIINYSTKKVKNNIFQIKALATHAYIINRKFMEKIKSLKYTGVAIDYIYIYLSDKSYAIFPSLFTQDLAFSDIQNKNLSLIQSEALIQSYFNLLEFYARYINIPICSKKFIMVLILCFVIYVCTKKLSPSLLFFICFYFFNQTT